MSMLLSKNRECLDQSNEAGKFKSNVFKWAEKLDVEPKEIHLRSMKNKWASLSQNGRLTFNTELLEMKRELCDYVIVHELLHMKVPNHGKLFKSLMFACLPGWEKYSERLKVDR
jgi:predicted metal-dependent hydrolase